MKSKIYGVFLLFEAFFMFLTSLVAFYYHYQYGETDVAAFLASTMVTGTFGFILLSAGREKHDKQRGRVYLSNLTMKDSFIIVTVTWILFSIFGMLPFLMTGTINSITDAFFESISGFTTTGITVVEDIDNLSHGILFWRSMIQWLGGLGIIVLFLAIIPAINRSSNNVMLFSAEMSGIGVKKLHPKMMMTARRLWSIYIMLTLMCAFFYYMGPMNFFDAVCHAMSTIATGGISTHNESFGYWNSPYLEYVGSFFMLISGVNFSLYYLLITGHLGEVAKNEELRWYIGIFVLCVALFIGLFYIAPDVHTVYTDISAYPQDFESRFRTSLFYVSSVISSTSFQSSCSDFNAWGGLFMIPTLLIMVSGACAGSSSGGIKIIRVAICLKSVNNAIKKMLHPNAVFTVRMSKEVIIDEQLARVLNFLFFYLFLCIFSVIVLILTGCNFDESIFNTITALSNMGPSIGRFAAGFDELSAVAKWFMSFLMLVGRLEIFTVLILFTPAFWKNK